MANRLVAGRIRRAQRLRILWQFLAAGAGVGLITYYGVAFQVRLPIMSFLYLLLVVLAATRFGFWQASMTSLLAAACLDYFFTPPLFTFNVTYPQDFVALGAFEATALVIGRLSARELRKAREAEAYRAAMEQLYELSRSTLLLDLHQPPGPQLAVLIQRVFGLRAVALFDLNLGRQAWAGDWREWESDLARECYLRGTGEDDQSTQTAQRVLRSGHGPMGALAIRGELSPLAIDGLAALAAIAMDRCQSYETEERAEIAVESEQLRGAVLDALAHEIKTPLTAVQAASSGLLELGGLSASQMELAGLIDNGAARLSELCNRLLKAARLEAKPAGLKTAAVSIGECAV